MLGSTGADDAGIRRAGPPTLDRLDIARADVLGLSFGGLVAQQLAYDAPTRVRGLVLVSTTCGLGGVPTNPASWWTAMLSGVWPAAGAPGSRQLARRWSRVIQRELARRMDHRSAAGRIGRADRRRITVVQFGLVTATNSGGTLVITGTAEDAVGATANASILLLASRMPRAQLHRVHGGGRMCLFDRAAEVGPVVSAFLRSLERTAINKIDGLEPTPGTETATAQSAWRQLRHIDCAAYAR